LAFLLRQEITCMAILVFLIAYYLLNKIRDDNSLFLKFATLALVHVIIGTVTLGTVNNIFMVTEETNKILLILQYLTIVLFIECFYDYIVDIAVSAKNRKKFHYFGSLLFFVSIIFCFILPIKYENGIIIRYSNGPAVYVVFVIILILSTISFGILISTHRKLPNRIKKALIPQLILVYMALLGQALYPEMLVTSAGVTFISLGVFISMDNPDKDYKQQAYWDFSTGLKNRNCYNRDIAKYQIGPRLKNPNQRIGFLVADINDLKTVNDNYGHHEGDKLISSTANILKSCLKTATDIYRIGGDEFIALYLDPDDDTVNNEIANINKISHSNSANIYASGIAIGYVSGFVHENVHLLIQKADRMMYVHKTNMKSN